MGNTASNQQSILDNTSGKTKEKKLELEGFKDESLEAKDFKDNNYTIQIDNCFIVEQNGKKYIALREIITRPANATISIFYVGDYYVNDYIYKDVLSLDKDGNPNYLFHCSSSLFSFEPDFLSKCSNEVFAPRGDVPDYEQHILKVFPELSKWPNGLVPISHLMKCYDKINDLGNKKLIRK